MWLLARYVAIVLTIAVTIAGAAVSAAPETGSRVVELGYPSKPVRMLVGFSPGGATDVVAWILRALSIFPT